MGETLALSPLDAPHLVQTKFAIQELEHGCKSGSRL